MAHTSSGSAVVPANGGGAFRSAWIHRESAHPDLPARFRLFCFPYAGGGASVFHHWVRALPPGLELCAIQLPGRENRWAEPPVADFAEMIHALANELHPCLNLPFAFLGHSLGALIAFELARTLRRRTGELPARLFVCGARAPHLPELFPPIGALPDSAFLSALVRLQGIPEEVASHGDLMRLLLPTLRADISLCESYIHRWEQPLECPISAYGGLQDVRVPHHDLDAWRVLTLNELDLCLFAGGHFFITTARDKLLSVLSRELNVVLALVGCAYEI